MIITSAIPLEVHGAFLSCAAEDALSTVVRLFCSVPALVLFKITSLSARIVALITLEWLFSSVLEFVFFQTHSLTA